VPVQTSPPSLLYNGYRVFPGGKERPGRDTDPSSSISWTACTEPQCLYKGALYLYLLHAVCRMVTW